MQEAGALSPASFKINTMRKYQLLFLLTLLLPFCLAAQPFYESGQFLINEEQFLSDLYFNIYSLQQQTEAVHCSPSRITDKTIIVKAIRDEAGKIYHVVIHTDSKGNIVYAGCSRNLIERIDARRLQTMSFNNCIRNAVNAFSVIEKEKAVYACFLEKLNNKSK
jgi:hypothetical protein